MSTNEITETSLPGAPELSKPGPFAVGTRTVRITARDRVDVLRLSSEEDPRYDRPLRLDVFYPAVASPSASRARYDDVLSSTDGAPKLPFTFEGLALRDASVDASKGPYPLVVVTHGYPGSSVATTWLTENLASKGYVVVAIDVTDSTHADIGPRAITLLQRPLDILSTIAFAEGATRDAASFLHGTVDVEHIGLVGYSMGGYASLNVAGAGFSRAFVEWPTSVPRGRLAIRESGNATYAATLDRRIRAVALISPWGGGVAWDASGLAGVRVPLLFFAGTSDDVAGFDPGVRTLFEGTTSTDRHLVVLRDAGHSIGLDPPPREAATRPADYYHYADAVWDQRHVNDVLRHFVTAFLGTHVRGDTTFDPFLSLTSNPASTGRVNAENVAAAETTWPGFTALGMRGLEFHTRMRLPTPPQFDPAPSERAKALESERAIYRFDHARYEPLAMSAAVPPRDQFPAAWFRTNIAVVGTLLENAARAAQVRRPADGLDASVLALAATAKNLGPSDDPLTILAKAQTALAGLRPTGNATSLADFAALFQTIPAPPLVYGSVDDAWFTRNFLAGSDPMIVRLLTAIDATRMSLSDAVVEAALGAGVTIASAIRDRLLFVADFGVLRGAECGVWNGRPKYLPAPIAYFGVGANGALRPVAIQLADGHDAPLLKPTDGASWLVARTAVMCADATMSAIYFHHAKTHMVIEPIVVAANRQLAPTHPIRILLAPHFVGTLAINLTGQVTVFEPHGLIESVGAATRPAFRALAIEAVRSQDVRALVPRRALAERGVLDAARLPDFAFRDDSLLLWDAIEGWVRDYVGLYYATDADVAGDTELRAWIAEAGAQDGGRLAGLGSIATKADLVEIVTIVIHTASAQHWALNAPLATWMTFAPNFPLAMWAEPKPTPDVAGWLAMLPPLDMAEQQLEAAYGMGSTRYGVLGAYPDDCFADPRVRAPLEAFQARLREVERTITARNRTRAVPYEFLLPSQLPASINI